MGFLITSIQPQAAYWDFTESGGAVSTIKISMFVIPVDYIITRFFAKTFISVLGGAGATISVDLVQGAVITPGFFLPVTPIANFVNTPGLNVLPGFNFAAAPFAIDGGAGEIQVTIAGNDLTAGRVAFHVESVGMNNLI